MRPIIGSRTSLGSAVLVAIVAAFACSSGDEPKSASSKPADPQTIAELEARIRHIIDSAKVPGMGLAIVRQDSIVYTGGFGNARLSPKVPATDSTLFRIGSTSKAFVALTAMALVNEGKLSLDDKLADRLPGFFFRNPWESTDPIRVKHLLEHTSGFDDNSMMGYALDDTTLTLERGLQLDSATHVSRWRPGTHMSYCNSGPAIVALMIEKIEGAPFEVVVQRRWFDRIGMRSATFMRPDSTRTPVATLYMGDPPKAERYWNVFIRPAGSINASAHDMGAYVRFLTGRGTVGGVELLPKASLERMEQSLTTTAARAGLAPGFGLHLYRSADSSGYSWTQHNGGVTGGLSDMSYLPDVGVGYAFQINTGNGEAFRLLTQTVRAYVTRGITPVLPELPRAPIATATRTQFAGWYRPISPRVQHIAGLEAIFNIMHVSFRDSTLVVAPLLDDDRAFVAVDSMRFRRPGEREATFAFVRDTANGRERGYEDVAGGFAVSYAQIGAIRAVLTLSGVVVFLLGLPLALVAMLFGGCRRLVARVRRRALVPAPSRRAWRGLAVLAMMIVVWIGLFAAMMDDLQTIGTRNGVSGSAWALGYAFVAGSVLVLARGWRGAIAGGAVRSAWSTLSLWTARVVMASVVVGAVYLLAQGLIGWRTWVA